MNATEVELQRARIRGGNSDPVRLDLPGHPRFRIGKAKDPGDDTVPAASGAAPGTVGSAAVKQSFGLIGLAHGSSFQEEDGAAQLSTLYSIGKIIGRAT